MEEDYIGQRVVFDYIEDSLMDDIGQRVVFYYISVKD
jgi:hypothetical protein